MICKKTHFLEKIGTLIVIGGACMMIFDPLAIRVGEKVNNIADALTLITNIPGVLLWIGLDYMLKRMDLASVIFL